MNKKHLTPDSNTYQKFFRKANLAATYKKLFNNILRSKTENPILFLYKNW